MSLLDRFRRPPAPAIGDRHIGALLTLEWTGDLWLPVCPTDNVRMGVWDAQGFPTCGSCGARPDDIEKRSVS